MNDFSEIENELRKLRPAQPSPILFERIEEAMMNCREGAWSATQSRKPSPYNWLSLGFGLAAAAALVLFAAISMEHQHDGGKEIAQISRESETAPLRSSAKESTSSDKFLPAGATRLVYNTRNEGLQFASRCGGFVTRLVRPGSGVIQRPARHFVCLIPARKSSSFRCQANDLTN